MEFYLSRYAHKHTQSSFQFPTGWNSTKLYCSKDISSLYSFNSQRDGILLFTLSRHSAEIKQFQFPTGWNSTFSQPTLERTTVSFNSQRDGILPKHTILKRNFGLFQFPTGWNSTIDKADFPSHGLVSIPNGMEFYPLISPFVI